MTEQNLRALKTICGAIHYTLITYNTNEIGQRDWEYLCSYLNIDRNTIYGIELAGSGFVFWSKAKSFRYRGNQFHQYRQVHIIDSQ